MRRYFMGNVILLWYDMASTYRIVKVIELLKKLTTLQSRRLLQGLIKQREIELSCDIST